MGMSAALQQLHTAAGINHTQFRHLSRNLLYKKLHIPAVNHKNIRRLQRKHVRCRQLIVMKTSPVILRQIDNMNPFHSRTYIFCNNPDRIKGCRNQKSLLLLFCPPFSKGRYKAGAGNGKHKHYPEYNSKLSPKHHSTCSDNMPRQTLHRR